MLELKITIKESVIVEHLVNNQNCADNFNFDSFETFKCCCNIFDLVKWRLSVFQIRNLPFEAKGILVKCCFIYLILF